MNYCCENCGWSEIIGSPIMCNYSERRTWRDECCEAWKPKEETHEKDRAIVLLRAAKEMIERVDPLEVGLVHYDDADCDANCLISDIKAYLEDKV